MAKNTGESKAPIVIALAFFVLATITLGILTYLASDEKAQLVESATAAEKKASEAQNLTALAQEKLLVYKTALGVNTAEEFEELQNARNKEEAHAAFVALKTEVDQALSKGAANGKGLIAQKTEDMIAQRVALGIDPNAPMNIAVNANSLLLWNWPTADAMQKPQRSILGTTVEAVGNQQLSIAKMNTQEDQYAISRKNYDDATKIAEQNKNAFIQKSDTLTTELETKRKQIDADFEQRVKTFNDFVLEYTKAKNQLVETANAKDIRSKELQGKVDALRDLLGRLEGELEASEDPFSFDNPHGEVTSVSGNLITINIGSAANVHAGLTFSVQPSDTPTTGLQARQQPKLDSSGRPMYDGQTPLLEIVPKGTIQVTRVLGPNLSQARITSEPNPIRDAILKGDVLYNAAWQPGAADNIALFGLFDVDADGIDDIKRVVRDLEKMGINVNAYYDLDQKKWIGKLTERTYYVVEGYYPTLTGAGDETIRNAKSQLTAALLAAKTEAREKGGKIVKIRDFFPRIGYTVNTDISNSTINQAYLPYLRTAPAANGFGN